MAKRLAIIVLAAIMTLGMFGLTACGGNKVNKIDIGGIISRESMLSCETRVIFDKDTFLREDEVKIKVGFGFGSRSVHQYYVGQGFDVVLKITAKDFFIIDEQSTENENLYQKLFEEYSDSKFVCTKKNKRYIPNYYETFKIKFSLDIDSSLGCIQALAGPYYAEDNIDGHWVTIYYAANSKKIAFSAKSKTDAQKKLK